MMTAFFVLLVALLALREWPALKPGCNRLLRRGLPGRVSYDVATLTALALLLGPAASRPVPQSADELALAFAVDVSPSMAVTQDRISRLDRARQHMARLLPHLEGARIAVVAFAGQPVVLSPATRDLNAVRLLIDALEPGLIDAPGTAPEEAVKLAGELLQDRGTRLILLYSDGERTWPEKPPELDAQIPVISLLPGATRPAKVPGREKDTAVSRPDRQRLERIAQTTGGQFLLLDGDAFNLEQLHIPGMQTLPDSTGRPLWLWLLFLLLLVRSLPLPAGFQAGSLAIMLILLIPGCGLPSESDEAADLFRQAEALSPSERSITLFEQAAREATGPTKAAALHNACSDALALERPRRALQLCTRSLLANPQQPDTITNLALAWRMLAQQPAGADANGSDSDTDKTSDMTAEQARSVLQGMNLRPGGHLPPKGRPQPIKPERDW